MIQAEGVTELGKLVLSGCMNIVKWSENSGVPKKFHNIGSDLHLAG